jgi:hypothetical protein
MALAHFGKKTCVEAIVLGRRRVLKPWFQQVLSNTVSPIPLMPRFSGSVIKQREGNSRDRSHKETKTEAITKRCAREHCHLHDMERLPCCDLKRERRWTRKEVAVGVKVNATFLVRGAASGFPSAHHGSETMPYLSNY